MTGEIEARDHWEPLNWVQRNRRPTEMKHKSLGLIKQ